jgi:hippurate hydrolase
MGGGVDVHIDKGYPAVFNDEKLNASAQLLAEEFMGKNVHETECAWALKISATILN